jgi:hypothetical protein
MKVDARIQPATKGGGKNSKGEIALNAKVEEINIIQRALIEFVPSMSQKRKAIRLHESQFVV